MKYSIKYYILFCFLLMITGFLQAQTTDASGERRIALVIGNSDYLHGPLTNPVNDARSMARVLRNAGFEVILGENLSNKTEMKRLIRDFGFKLAKGGVGLFYYAGHGLQVEGFNFLVPVNAVINNEAEVEYEAVDAGFVIAQMEAAQNRLNIVILDACRNNPYARSFRSSKQGLSGMNAPTGTLIAYATAPGSVAIDGSGVNGLYTQELLAQINKPDLQIEDVFKNVRAQVVAKSNGLQTPWESSSLIGDFYFYPENVAIASSPTPAVVPAAIPAVTEKNEFVAEWKAKDNVFWLYINGIDISSETSSRTRGKNLLVTHSKTNSKFLLENFWNLRDGQLRSAKILERPVYSIQTKASGSNVQGNPLDRISALNRPSPYTPNTRIKVFWRATSDSKYFLLVNGIDISKDTRHKLVGDDLYVYHPQSGRLFFLKGFTYRRDNRNRKAIIVK